MLTQFDLGMLLVGYSYIALDMVVWFFEFLFSTSLADDIEKRDNLRINYDKREKALIKEKRYEVFVKYVSTYNCFLMVFLLFSRIHI